MCRPGHSWGTRELAMQQHIVKTIQIVIITDSSNHSNNKLVKNFMKGEIIQQITKDVCQKSKLNETRFWSIQNSKSNKV